MPTAEGEIGSVARVAFQAQASARTISTRPQLKGKYVYLVVGYRLSAGGGNVVIGCGSNSESDGSVTEAATGNDIRYKNARLARADGRHVDATAFCRQ